MALVGVVVLVRVLVEMLCPNVGPPSEVAQGKRLVLSLGNALSESVSLVGGAALVKISVSCLSAAVCFPPNVVSGLVGVGLIRVCVRSAAAYVDASCGNSLGKVSVAGGEYVVSEILYFSVLGMYDIRQR